MKCRYCNVALAPLRSLTDGEFCCDEHRQAFEGRGAHRAGGSRGILEPAGDKSSYSTDHTASDQSASNDLRAMAQNLNAFDFQSSNSTLERSSSAPGPEAGFSASAELSPAVESPRVAVEPEPAGYIPAWSMGPETNVESEPNFSVAEAYTDESSS